MGDRIEVDPDSYYRLLRSLKGLPKEASQELRLESRHIAETILMPTLKSQIIGHTGPYGAFLADSVTVSRDRVPKVRVGNRRKKLSGGANSIMIRYGSIVGPYKIGNRANGGKSLKKVTGFTRSSEILWPRTTITPGWTDAAANEYTPKVFDAWESAVNKIVTKWNGGSHV